ncbi:MAG TPA: hypothetical protein VG028_13145 [Terriglobia bacterium]|nr:hypothetical protein [Terriglobia bacterium]
MTACYLPGSKVGDSDLFHHGFVIKGGLGPGWCQEITGDLLWWRSQNQIAMAASQAGFAVALNPSLGLNLVGPITGTGTATTTPHGKAFMAQHFQIRHLNYHLGFAGPLFREREMPMEFDVHGSRNFGAGFLRDAAMGILSFGDVQKPGDIRVLYAYAIKDGNSMISEVTDDYLGTLSGVNIRVHEFRFDLGLTKFLAWQNYFYIVNPRRGNDPALHFFVPYPYGANTNYRV